MRTVSARPRSSTTLNASAQAPDSSWRNWDGRQRCTPAAFARPASLEQLREVLARAQEAGHGVRVAGSGHSFTGLVLTEGTLVSLERMGRVLEVDRARGLVRVQAGITLRELNLALHRHGLALENLGDVDRQSIAGATATGTHGTGAQLRNISAQLQAVQLMCADGSILELDQESDPDAWRAARVSLGALGVVSALTLRVVPAFRLRAHDGPMPLDRALEQLDALVAEHDHFELYWFPYAEQALLRRNDRSFEPAVPRGAVRTYMDDVLLVNHGLGALCRLGRRHPRLIPQLNRLVTRLAGSSTRLDDSFRVFVSPRLVRFTEMEYAIPRERAAQAIREVRELLHQQRLPVSFPIEVRFVAADDALLSPAHGRDSCYIAVHVFDQMAYEPYFREVEAIMDRHDGRPHWGKRHFQTAQTLAPRYPEWERFAQVRARLDPEGLFANAELERVLGPVKGPGGALD